MKRTKIRDIDSIYFEDPYSPLAGGHLRLILMARKGDLPAQDVFHKRMKEERTRHADFDQRQVDLGEFSDYLVPSTSTESYSPEEIGDKGYNLLKLIRLSYPVPAFCLINAKVKEVSWLAKSKVMDKALEVLEGLTGKRFNDTERPLLFSLRSGLPENLPGLMPTYLNLGATQAAMHGLVKIYGEEGAYDLRINFAMTLILDCDPVRYKPVLDKLTNPFPESVAGKVVLLQKLERIMESSQFVTFKGPESHLSHFADRIMHFYYENRNLLNSLMEMASTHPIMILQEMVLGKLEHSFSGVFQSREPCEGEGSQLIVANQTFGGEIMTGGIKPEAMIFSDKMATLPVSRGVYELYDRFMSLEGELKSPVTLELTEERGSLAVLQMNKTSLSGPAVLKVAIDMYQQGKLERKDLLEVIQPYHLRQLFFATVVIPEDLKPVASGISILPRGEIYAKVYFSKDGALAAKAVGEKVILVQEDFSPTDVEVMIDMDGLICISPAAFHVTETARKYGIVSLVAINREGVVPFIEDGKLIIPGKDALVIREGEYVVISSERKQLYVGKAKTKPAKLAVFLMGMGKLSGEEQVLWEKLLTYMKHVEKITLEEVLDAGLLANLTNIFRFMNKKERAKEFVNNWFECYTEKFVKHFLNTQIGKHRGRINLFKLLEDKNIEKLVRLIVHASSESQEKAVFVLGRLLENFEAERGNKAYSEFIDKFSDDERKLLREERNKSKMYLEVSKIPPKTRAMKKTGPARRDTFLESLTSQLGEASVKKLPSEQIEQIRAIWDLDPDPTHKPRKTIKFALSKLGFKF
ncbi:MAG: hypothetical protein ACFFCW_23510 [Candidatus Hodarchaeota archaeon]